MQDTGVFAITTIWSIIAYIWLYVVLIDGEVKEWEAYLTLGFFFALILMAYIADCCRRKTMKDREDDRYGHEAKDDQGDHKTATGIMPSKVATMSVVSFYNLLLPIEGGQECKPEDDGTATEMKEFLLREFGTTKVSEVNKDDLKAKLDGPALLERVGYRKAVAINAKKEAIAKG